LGGDVLGVGHARIIIEEPLMTLSSLRSLSIENC
jgi:hypothetical protein